MWRWELILGLPLHYTSMTVSLHWCFPLGRSRRLPLVVCCFLLPWSWFAEDRIVLGNVPWQFGPSLFVFRHIFLLGMGLGLDIKWVGVAKSFGPIIAPQNLFVRLLGRGGGFWCPRAYITADQVLSPISARASSPAQGTLLAFRCTRHAIINTFMERRRSLQYTRHTFIGAFMKRRKFSGWGFPWKSGETHSACNSLFGLHVNQVPPRFRLLYKAPWENRSFTSTNPWVLHEL